MCVSIVRATRIQFITFKMHAVHFSLCQLIVFCFMLFSQSLFLQQSLVFGWFSDFVVSAELWKKNIQQQQNKSLRISELYTDKWTSPMYIVQCTPSIWAFYAWRIYLTFGWFDRTHAPNVCMCLHIILQMMMSLASDRPITHSNIASQCN